MAMKKIVLSGAPHTFSVIDPGPPDDPPIGDTLYFENFNNTGLSIPHVLNNSRVQSVLGWGNCPPADVGNLTLVQDPAFPSGGGRGTVLKIDFWEGNYAIYRNAPGYTPHLSGMQSHIYDHSGLDELYMACDIFVPDNFIYNFAMKNTRIGGGEFQSNSNPANYGKYCEAGLGFWGNNPSADAFAQQYECGSGFNGIDGEIAVYQYYATRFQHSQLTGDSYNKGQWNRMELHVKINTPYTSENGEFHCWQNGQLILSSTNRQWRNAVNPTMQWERITLVFYEGGDAACWSCPQNQSLYIDNIIVSEAPITH